MFGVLHTVMLLVALLILNEIFRESKWATIIFFLVVPIVLTPLVWVKTGNTPGSTINTWFHWAKLYSVIIAVLGFTAFRYTKLDGNKFMKFFPALILGVNIAEAVARDFELGLASPAQYWHFLNGIAGILSIITISGWSGIYTEHTSPKKDMLWPDMMTLWIIAYDVWNLVYIWFCVPEHAGFGIAVLLSCTIPSLWIKKGTWIQARAFTLAAWMMYLFTFNSFVDNSAHRMSMPTNPSLMVFLGLLSLGLNGAFAWIHFSKMFKKKNFKLGDEVHAY
jgi:hypothetical protein